MQWILSARKIKTEKKNHPKNKHCKIIAKKLKSNVQVQGCEMKFPLIVLKAAEENLRIKKSTEKNIFKSYRNFPHKKVFFPVFPSAKKLKNSTIATKKIAFKITNCLVFFFFQIFTV